MFSSQKQLAEETNIWFIVLSNFLWQISWINICRCQKNLILVADRNQKAAKQFDAEKTT